jgi:SOS-response transcriptional repressor LexA
MQRTAGIAPFVPEIAGHLRHRSPTRALHLLSSLQERGFIRRLPGKDCAIEVVKPVSRFTAYRFDAASKQLTKHSSSAVAVNQLANWVRPAPRADKRSVCGTTELLLLW